MLVSLLALLALAPADRPDAAVRYSMRGPPAFRQAVRETLSDPRGWSLGGAVEFREVPHGGRFTVRLAAPATVAGFYACSPFYSCRSGEHVLVNSMRWREGAAAYGDRLAAYRRHVVNHEVGHALGFGHAVCGRPGARAAVMQQQSKGLQGCRAREWPLARERRALAAMLGVRARPPTLRPMVRAVFARAMR